MRSPKVIAAAMILLLASVGLLLAVTRDGPPEAHAQEAGEEMPAIAPAGTEKGGLAAADSDSDGVVYQSGMHPWIVQDEPGQCPICGMDLLPVPVDQAQEGVIQIDPVTLQNIGVRTTTVAVEPLLHTVRTTGRFEADEQRATVVSPKVSGWVEKLYVNYEGARVGRGQPLLEIYSPELVSTQEEYLLALRHLKRVEESPAAKDARRLVEAARRRLAYWDLTDAQIRALEEQGAPRKTLTLYAPASGTVTHTDVVQGQQVAAGQTLMQLADLSTLWLMVDVYEQDLAWVGRGTKVSIELPYDPGRTMTGEVSYLYDTLDPSARTARARVAVPNPVRKLKPGMYATVTLLGGQTEPRPVVPEEALIRTGEREVVILAVGEGRFVPAEVTAGLQADGRVQILDGLLGGEEVVTSAQFLIDAEARLRSAVGAMTAGPPNGSSGGAPVH